MNLDDERSRLLERDSEWAIRASEGSDIEAILSYWTDDATVIAPELPPVIGKAALRDYVTGSLQIPGFSITWKTSDAVLSPDGSFAYMFSDNTATVDGPDGSPIAIPGRAVTIWRKDLDGEWRCAVDIWNAPPAT